MRIVTPNILGDKMTKIFKLIICMCLITFLCSCKDNEAEILKKAERIKNKKTIILNSGFQNKEEITMFEFDGCEYIMYQKNVDTKWGVLGLTHKGNCKYCSKNIKIN
jgi:hypothetical protein